MGPRAALRWPQPRPEVVQSGPRPKALGDRGKALRHHSVCSPAWQSRLRGIGDRCATGRRSVMLASREELEPPIEQVLALAEGEESACFVFFEQYIIDAIADLRVALERAAFPA